jgi:hypothetical protein
MEKKIIDEWICEKENKTKKELLKELWKGMDLCIRGKPHRMNSL